mgnify:FL=1
MRGCSYYFSSEMSRNFLERNRLISIIRAHEAQIEGYRMYKWNGFNQFPTVITIFSAPNYCDVYRNKGAVIKFVVKSFGDSEQYLEHSAVQLYRPSLSTSQLHGCIQLVYSIRG